MQGWRRARAEGERGSAVVEFAVVSVIALLVTLAVIQFALFLYERNVLVTALAEGARVAAAQGSDPSRGLAAATQLHQQSAGGLPGVDVRLAAGTDAAAGTAVLTARGALRPFLPGLPGLPVDLRATMHEEDRL